MEYKKITVTLTPYNEDAAQLLMAQMGERGFESFCETDCGFEAYIPSALFSADALSALDPIIENISVDTKSESIPDQDWNKTWEENYFTPIVVDNKCLIRSTFHKKEVDTQYEIIINPQMSFGTGHHETTCLMLQFILEHDFTGKKVLDMGCGTGILGILASMKGAESVRGIDIDEWCYNNTTDNLKLNGISNMSVAVGDAQTLDKENFTYDIILANINRNILLNDMSHYVKALNKGGLIAVSGFYIEDVKLIVDCACQLGLTPLTQKTDNKWTMISFEKH
ncbi:MAG: 50S ribosomal protein L11 methyltransferase [Bacteroidales bacterium]|nr:50S ribosomal protein L11 methyltransferase [Bacteroidales bacterium]